MQLRVGFLSFVVAICCAVVCDIVSAQDLGRAAPQIEIGMLGAKPLHLSDLKGRVVYLDFWASWCGPCKQSFPWMNEMQSKYGSRGLQVFAVNLDKKREDADKFLSEIPVKFNVAYDPTGKSAEVYKPKGMPTSYLIGADGVIRSVHTGFRESDRNELEQEIAAALTAAGRK